MKYSFKQENPLNFIMLEPIPIAQDFQQFFHLDHETIRLLFNSICYKPRETFLYQEETQSRTCNIPTNS